MFFRKALEQEAFRNTRRHKLIRNQPFLTHFSGFFINSFTQGNQREHLTYAISINTYGAEK